MNANEKIKARREQLGFSDIDVARAADISIYAYGDIEQHSREVLECVDIYVVKKICDFLRLDFFELLGIHCAFCESDSEFLNDYIQSRNKVIQQGRNRVGLTVQGLGDIVGFEDIAITTMESNPDFLESWVVSDISNLAEAIRVPLQILLNAKCPKCGR